MKASGNFHGRSAGQPWEPASFDSASDEELQSIRHSLPGHLTIGSPPSSMSPTNQPTSSPTTRSPTSLPTISPTHALPECRRIHRGNCKQWSHCILRRRRRRTRCLSRPPCSELTRRQCRSRRWTNNLCTFAILTKQCVSNDDAEF